jgi:hypothetical protein
MGNLSGSKEMKNTCGKMTFGNDVDRGFPVLGTFLNFFFCLPWILCPAISQPMETVTEL